MRRTRIFVVEDNVLTSKEIVTHLQNLGYDVAGIAYSGEDAIHKVSAARPDLMLMDINLGKGMDGTEAANHIQQLLRIPIVYLTAYTDQETLERAKITEPFGYVIKPFDERTLYVAIETALAKHRAEETMAQQKALLTEVFEHVQEGLALVDDCGLILFCNPAYATIVGESFPVNLVGQNVFSFFDHDARTVLIQELKARRQGKISTYELPLISKRAEAKYVHLTVAPRFDLEHVWIGEFIAMLDITERKRIEHDVRWAKDAAERMEQKALDARQAAESANQTKSEFLAHLSHELRSPLNGILGYVRLLAQDSATPPQHSAALEMIRQSGEYMLTLLDEVLDFSRIEANQLQLSISAVRLPWFLTSLQELVRGQSLDKGVQLHIQLAPDLPEWIQSDEIRLRQILLNLLNNALKFTDKGHVTLRVQRVCEFPEFNTLKDPTTQRRHSSPAHQLNNSATHTLRFEVEDTGAGIAPEHLDQIFLPFRQVGKTVFPQQGTGLGLAICRKLLRLMGSDIAVRSTLGQGSTFWFDLALPEAQGEASLAKYYEHLTPAADASHPAPEIAQEPSLSLPPRDVLTRFYEFARQGDIVALQTELALSLSHDPASTEFMKQIEHFIKSFQMNLLQEFLEQYVPPTP